MTEKRLLVCDDEKRFAKFVGTVAVDLGFEVELTAHPHEFMGAYERFRPTTIVLDMIMPDMDGNELILWLAKRQCTADLIIITGYNPDYAMNAKILANFKGLRPATALRKPIGVAELRAALLKSASPARETARRP